MKLLKWMPVSQLVKKKDLNKRRLFEDESSRNSFGMDEDSNMSNVSNASDSQDGIAQNNVQAQDKEGTKRMTMVSGEGAIYRGETSEGGKRQGRGEYIWLNGDKYQGDFSNGLKDGNGILYFSNGDKRVGVWKEDKLHGPATYYYAHGRIDEETWENDNKVSEKRRK